MKTIESITDKANDDKIRMALRNADAKGKLSVVAAVVGTSEKVLREVMNSTGELSIIDRGMLSIHLVK